MDNFRIDVTARNPEDFRAALSIAWNAAPAKVAFGYRVDQRINEKQPPRLIFYWWISSGSKTIPLPFEMHLADAIPFIEAWLRDADYGPEPDHDGDNHRGWRVYNGAWGRVDSDSASFVAIEPVWAMYGK